MSKQERTQQNSPFPGPGGGPGRRGPGGPMMEKPKVKNPMVTLIRLWSYMSAYKMRIMFVVLLVLITCLQEMLTPWFISIVIDRFIIPHKIDGLLNIIMLFGGLLVIVAVASWLQQSIMIRVTQKSLQRLRHDLFTNLQRLDLRYYDSHTHGELMSRFTNDIETISNVVAQVVTQFLSSIFSVTGVIIMMFILNVHLALVTVVTIPIILVITKFVGSKTHLFFKNQQNVLGELNGEIEETITGMKIVKLFRREADIANNISKTNEQLKKISIKAMITAGVMGPIMNLTNNLRYAIVAAAGGILGIMGLTTIGTIAAFLNYTRQFGRPINEIAQLYNMILSALAGAERVFEVIDVETNIKSPENAIVLENVKGKVVFENVDFSYSKDVPILKNISFTAEPGKTVALVGPTGAGKTTIINLLTRFYDIDSGTVTIDDHKLADYELASLRRKLGLVLQDTFLFGETVMENIRYGNLDASDDEVRHAAEASRADHFIRHLPDGYQTILSEEGGNLSQGQRQLIAISRAILADPSILILDEATSNVDTRTEKLIQEGMLQLMKGRTSFVIAHRLSTIRNADLILVLKDGEIIERGNHDELIAQKGFYAGLHTAHFETEIR